MFNVKKKDYRIFEGIRAASMLTFISGFIDAFTYLTQGGRFAGMQTGNVIYLTIYLANGNFAKAASYVLPILVFMLGQMFTYLLREWTINHHFHWHILSGRLLFLLLLVTCLITPYKESSITIIVLSFFASVQVDTFRKIRGLPYANIMMTGNLRTLSKLLAQAIKDKDHLALSKAVNIMIILFAFMVGVACSTICVNYFQEYSLYLTLLPLAFLNVLLYIEKHDD